MKLKTLIKRKEYFQQSFGFVILDVLDISKYGLYLIWLLYFVMFFDSCVCMCVRAHAHARVLSVCVCVVCLVCVCVCGLLGAALCIDNITSMSDACT